MQKDHIVMHIKGPVVPVRVWWIVETLTQHEHALKTWALCMSLLECRKQCCVKVISQSVCSEPSSNQKREVELQGSHSELDRPLLQLSTAKFSGLCFCDSVPHSCWKSKSLSTQVALHWWGPHHLNIYCSGGCWQSLLALQVGALGTSCSYVPSSPPSLTDCLWFLWTLSLNIYSVCSLFNKLFS